MSSPADATAPASSPTRHLLAIPITAYALSTSVVLLGVQFGRAFVRPWRLGDGTIPATFFSSFTVWDGGWYRAIVDDGYSGPSAFAFFPAYPLLGRAVAWLTHLPANLALLLTSHLCLVPALILLYAYARRRTPDDPATGQWALASITLLPTTFFFRMAYAEALLLLVITAFLVGVARNWPAWALALIVGFGTAVRPPGVALLVPLAVVLFDRSKDRAARIAGVGWLIVGTWGLLAYIAYCWASTRDPLAFAHAQSAWDVRRNVGLGEKVLALLSFAPIRGVYNTSSGVHFSRMMPVSLPFNLYFANSIYFVLAVVLTAVGAWKRWLNRVEIALGFALIAFPYVTHAYETTMYSTGRFMAVVVPAHLVVGNLLRRAPVAVATGLVAVSAFLLGTYSALFGLWYWLI